MALKPAFPYDIYRARQDYVEDADPVAVHTAIKFLWRIHGDAFATDKEVMTMLNDTSHARDILANSGYVAELNAFFYGYYMHAQIIDVGHSD